MKNYDKCDLCNNKAVWFYMPGKEKYCDDCVPRGCSCNLEPKDDDWENEDEANWFQSLDEKGRELPCCEYWRLQK